jgi:hypothetical protein
VKRPEKTKAKSANSKNAKGGSVASEPTKSRSVGAAATRSRTVAAAPNPGSRTILIIAAAAFALLAVGGAVYSTFASGDATPAPSPVVKADAPAAGAAEPGAAPAATPTTPELTALDRAKKAAQDAEAMESAHREGDAVTALDAALESYRTFDAKKTLTDCRAAILARFKSRIAEASTVVASGDLARARSVLGDLKARCPDSLVPELTSVQSQLEGALARRDAPPPSAATVPTPTPPATPKPSSAPPAAAPDPDPAAKPDEKKPGEAKTPPGGKLPGKDKDEGVVGEKARAIRSLLFEEKVAEAAKLVPELERLAPDSPVMRAARGMVAYDDRRYAESLEDLAAGLAYDATDDQVRTRLASCHFLFGHYDEARELAKDSKSSECQRLVYLIDGPWAESFPLGHAALEQRTPNGHYAICSDLGLELGATDTLERDLGNAPAAKRPAMLKKFHDAHPGLKELVTNFEAAYKAYAKLFKIGTGKEDKGPKAEPKKDAADPKKDSTIARDRNAKAPPRDKGRVTRVYVFREKEEFAAFSSKLGIGSTEHILGYFMPSVKILAFYREQSNEEDLVTRELHNVLFHETFHQFLDLFIADAPPWFNEGLAEYFGISELSKDGLKYGLVPDGTHGGSRYTNLQEVLSPTYASMYGGTCPTLFALMKLNHSDFMTHGAANYAVAWGLVHFFASTTSGQKKLKAYFRGLRDGVPKDEIFRKVFGDMDQPKLEADFRAHVGDMAFNRPPPDDGD